MCSKKTVFIRRKIRITKKRNKKKCSMIYTKCAEILTLRLPMVVQHVTSLFTPFPIIFCK